MSGTVYGEFQFGTSVAPVGSASSAGTQASLALADHMHIGMQQVALGGNTSGNSQTLQGTLVLAGGNNVTLSGATAPGAMTVTINAGTGPFESSSSYMLGVTKTNQGTTGTLQASAQGIVMPFTIPYAMTISALNPIPFLRTMATSAAVNSGSQTYSFGIYSCDTTASSFIPLASGSFSVSHTLDSTPGAVTTSLFYSGIRTTTASLNTSITLSPTGSYALAILCSSAGLGAGGFLTHSLAVITADIGAWGVTTNTAPTILSPFAPNGSYASSLRVSGTIAFTDVTIHTSSGNFAYVGIR